MVGLVSLTLLRLMVTLASAAEPSASAVGSNEWQVYAGCAAAYRANWQDRLTDPNRSRDMSAMIHDQSEDYKKTSVRIYQDKMNRSPDDAAKAVAQYVEANVERFIAMDSAGTLEAYLDQCPQPEVEQPN